MPVRERFQTFLGLSGDHEGIGIAALPDIFSSRDSVNCYVDKFGVIKKIRGYARQNSTAYTTDTGGDATKVDHLHMHVEYASNQFDPDYFLLAIFNDGANERELASSTDFGATWTFDFDYGNFARPLDRKWPWYMKQFGDTTYITNDQDSPRTFTSSGSAAITSSRSPTASASAGSGTGLTGTFEWKLVSMLTDKDRKRGSVASGEVILENEDADLTWTADSDTNVIGYEVYRTTGTGKVFYYAGYVEGRTTASYTDGLTDSELLGNRALREHGDAPPSGTRILEVHQQRMWWIGNATNPNRAYYSDPNDPDSLWLNNNYLEFQTDEHQLDEITGAYGEFNDQLVIFQDRAIWVVSGTGVPVGNLDDWVVRRTAAQLGTVSGKTVVRVPSGAKFTDERGSVVTLNRSMLAYLTRAKDIRVFDGENDRVISTPKQDFLDDNMSVANRLLAHAQHDKERKLIRWMFLDSDSAWHAVVWNYEHGTWHEEDTTPFRCSIATEDGTQEQLLLCGEDDTTVGGFVYKNWTGNNYDGVGNNIEARFWTKPLFGMDENGSPLLHKKKRFRFVEPVLKALSSAQEFSIDWYSGFVIDGATADGSATIEMQDASASHVQELVQLKDETGDYPTTRVLRLRFGDDADDSQWELHAFTLSYQELEGVRGR